MKTLLFFLPFLLLATTSLAASPDPVRDTAGKYLRTNANYFVLPVVRGRGGGLSLVATRNKTCPLDVVQEVQEILEGIPMTFTPVDAKKGVIRESTDLNIEFNAATVCPQYSTYWKLDRYDESRKRYFVTSGGVAGNPGAKTTSNWFKIEKYGKDYKFVFCPTVCKFCKVICKDVGIFVENGRRILALTDVAPLKVKFLMNEFV